MSFLINKYILYINLVAELLQADADAEEEFNHEGDVVDDIQCMDQDNVSTASPIPILPLVQDAFTQVNVPNMRSVAVSVRMKGKNKGTVKYTI